MARKNALSAMLCLAAAVCGCSPTMAQQKNSDYSRPSPQMRLIAHEAGHAVVMEHAADEFGAPRPMVVMVQVADEPLLCPDEEGPIPARDGVVCPEPGPYYISRLNYAWDKCLAYGAGVVGESMALGKDVALTAGTVDSNIVLEGVNGVLQCRFEGGTCPPPWRTDWPETEEVTREDIARECRRRAREILTEHAAEFRGLITALAADPDRRLDRADLDRVFGGQP